MKERHIGVLDGIRAMAIIMVVWFHFWQQTWLTPYITFDTSLTKYIGITNIRLADCVRYGYVFVDLLVLLSAFCNFYPYARAMVLGEEWPSVGEFYFKRAVRIIPSYLLCLFVVVFIFVIPEKKYDSLWALGKEVLVYLTCMGGVNSSFLIGTKLNGVLWTVQLEIIFYILIPWIAKLFRRIPGITYLIMLLVSVVSVNYILYQHTEQTAFYVNNILTFTGVYANGMLLSILFVMWKSSVSENNYTRTAATVVSVFCIYWFGYILNQFGVESQVSVVQLKYRISLSFLFSAFIFSTACAVKPWQRIFSNAAVRFICAISYNLYIWHQFIAVKLKEYRIPFWEGDTPPNMTGDKVWQWKYQILILVISVIVAIVVTYGFEIPVKNLLHDRRKRRK